MLSRIVALGLAASALLSIIAAAVPVADHETWTVDATVTLVSGSLTPVKRVAGDKTMTTITSGKDTMTLTIISGSLPPFKRAVTLYSTDTVTIITPGPPKPTVVYTVTPPSTQRLMETKTMTILPTFSVVPPCTEDLVDRYYFDMDDAAFAAKYTAQDPQTCDWASDKCNAACNDFKSRPWSAEWCDICHRYDFASRNYWNLGVLNKGDKKHDMEDKYEDRLEWVCNRFSGEEEDACKRQRKSVVDD